MQELLLIAALFLQNPQPIQTTSGTITGRLLSKDGAPAAGVRVTALVAPENGAQPASLQVIESIVQSDSSGRYRLESVPPGRYYITAGLVDFPSYYPGVTASTDAAIVTVRAGATNEGIDFRLVRPLSRAKVSVTGTLVLEGDGIPPRFSVMFNDSSGTAVGTSSVSPTGTFSVQLLIDEYAVTTSVLPREYTLKSIISNSIDLMRQPLNLTGASSSQFVVTIAVSPPPLSK